MKESIEVLQGEAGVIKRHIRMMKRVSDEYQTDLVKGWPEKLLDIEQGINRLQKSEVAQNSTSTQQLKDSISELYDRYVESIKLTDQEFNGVRAFCKWVQKLESV